MEYMVSNGQHNKLLSFVSGLIGISIIIIVHELGHFLAAHAFSIPTPRFSIGFGPSLLEIPLGQTVFQFALLPLGGYVEINQEILEKCPYMQKIIVMLAGIVFNIIFSFVVITYYTLRRTSQPTTIGSCLNYIHQQKEARGFIGPIGLIHIIGKCFNVNRQCFWIILAIISTNIALFNLLPLPFLDGGKVLLFTIEAVIKKPVSSTILSFFSLLFFLFFMLLIGTLSIKDISKLKKQ